MEKKVENKGSLNDFEVKVESALRNSAGNYAGPGTYVTFSLKDGSQIAGVVSKLLYGGDVLLTSGVKVNTMNMEDFTVGL